MAKILIKNGLVINRGHSSYQDVLVVNDRIELIDNTIEKSGAVEIDANGSWILPGIIDDQVHFRDPGLTHKATIYSESRAALAGGVTSFMEMPNTNPPAINRPRLEEKYDLASRTSAINYSFYIGATNDNREELLRTDLHNVCGIKIFMGSSTGNMLVDDRRALEQIFSAAHMLVATHCEDEGTIAANMEKYKDRGRPLSAEVHPLIRSREGCLMSSSLAVNMAKKYGTKLHILHISTKDELELFDNSVPLEKKHITAEACVHHLFFNSEDYLLHGNSIKCNPAIKEEKDRKAILQAVIENKIDVLATDHAPHTWEEKERAYLSAPSGLPLIQHGLNIMMNFYHKGDISREKIVEKMCHHPAILFDIRDRGYLDEGAFADIAICDPDHSYVLRKKDVRYKCGWSPLEGKKLRGKVTHVIINGRLAFCENNILEQDAGRRLTFVRN